MDAVALSWVATVYILAGAMALVPLGRIADVLGRKRIFLTGLLVLTAATLLCGLAPSAPVLIALRAVQGLGGAMLFGTSTAILVSAYPAASRGRVLGINVAAVYVGLSLGPFLGGSLTHALGWRAVFIVPVPLGIAAAVITAVKVRGEWRSAGDSRIDFRGSVVYSIALLALVYGLSRLPSVPGGLLVAGGLLGIGLFVLVERRSASPVLDVRLFTANRVFALSNVAALVNYSATAAVSFMLSLYLQFVKGLEPHQAGLVLVVGPLLQAITSPLAGRASDRVEPRVVASVGMGLTAAGLVTLVFLGPSTPVAAVIASLALLGVGFGLFSSPNTNAIMGSVEPGLYGTASGMVATMRMLGQMLSMAIAMLLLALFVGRVQLGPDCTAPLLATSRTAFLVFALLCAGGVFASLARGRLHRDRAETGAGA